MIRDPSKLSEQTFDLLIIGGGIVGAGIAWDAALRGLSLALVEQGDFACGTSSKTTKLIHGGIRYLEQLEFKLVRQSIQERKLLLQQAPHLVKPLPFLIPIKGKWPRPWPLVVLGVTLYDWLAGKGAVQRHRFLRGSEVQEADPLLSDTQVQRAAVYYDAQMDDAGLVLEVIRAAAWAGAAVVNHCSVTQFLQRDGRIIGAEVKDRITGEHHSIQAAVVVNATGPWADRIRRLADPTADPIVRMSKGIHLVYPDLGLKQALLLSAPSDGRIFFLIPWRGLTLIGTTDTDFEGDPGEARATEADVRYLIDETDRALPSLRLEPGKILSTFAGVRPLVRCQAPAQEDPWAVSRGHLIREDPNGLISIVGGKFTTFRAMAEEVVDRLGRRWPKKRLKPCETAKVPWGLPRLSERSEKISSWIQADPRLGEPLCPHHPFLKADVRYAVEEEMAISLSDLLWRRFQIGHSVCQGLDAAEPAAELMGELQRWSQGEVEREIDRYREEVALSRTV